MIHTSLLLKPVTALAVVFFAVATWAADTSEEQEGTKLYCVKRIDAEDGKYLLQLSQHYGNYTPGSGEQCFEKWYSSAGAPSVHSTVAEYLNGGDVLIAIQLASDIDFGSTEDGYYCNEEFRPFESEESVPQVAFMSADNNTYTIKGLCYINLYGGATFGGDIIKVMTNVRFEDVFLESTQFAGLLGSVGDAQVANVSVDRATVRAPVAGILSGSVYSLNVINFVGSGIVIESLPQAELGNIQFERVPYVRLGGLAGTVNDITATGVHFSSLIVSNNPTVFAVYEEETFVEMLASLETYVGGVVGVAQSVQLIQVGIEESSLLKDRSSGGAEKSSFVGGLVGGVMSMDQFQVLSTYTWADITCSKDTSLCRVGYIAGLLKIDEDPGSEMRVTSNFHYTQSESDVAIGMIGELYCAYASQYDQEATQCADGFNSYGELPTFDYQDDPDTPVKSATAFARGNYRSASSTLEPTSGFDAETYTFTDGDHSGYSIGVIDNSYMLNTAFAEALNNLDADYGSGATPWLFDESQNYPYMQFADMSPGGSDFNMYRITFRLDCIESGCLTDNEVAALVQFSQYQIGSYEYEFPTDEYGAIANQDWVDFAGNLQKSNSEREPVHWESVRWDDGSYKEFAINNKYSFDHEYNLVIGEAPQDADTMDLKVYAFFGKGIDYSRTIVELISYDGEDVEEKGNEIDRANYSGGDQPVVMNVGNIMQVTARNLVTTDGSAFKGWTVLAEMVYMTDNDGLRKKAFAGVPAYVYSDGSFSFDEIGSILEQRFEPLVDSSQYLAWESELDKIYQEMQAYYMSAEVDEDSMARIEARCDSIDLLMQEWTENQEATMYDDVVIVLAIYPKGFEEQNGTDPYPVDPRGGDEPQHDSVLVEVEYPALFQSGNAIQLAVKTDEFVYEENAPFVSVRLEDLGGEPLQDTLFEFTDGEWPEIFTWEKYPLAPGSYLLTAKIYDGKDENPDVRQWDFEVKAQIADGCGDCWYMVSLSNVVLDKVNPSDVNVLYWWNEQSMNGKYWQYEEVERESDVDRSRGYWYNSIEGLPLELDGEPLDDEFVVWEVDSVFSGWNMVRNPFGWYIDVSDLKRQGYAYYSWNSEQGGYDQPQHIKPYEAFWIKTSRYEVIDLPSTPAFIDMVDADGNTVPYRALQKKQVLAKAAGAEDWNVQVSLFDTKGKADTWNVLGVGKDASSLDEPPAGMGDHVNLTIVDAGRRLAKSVKEESSDAAYEWNVEISATSARMGYLKVDGVDALRAYGLRAFLTIDGVTTELSDDGKVQVGLSTAAKTVTLRIASAARKVVASTLQGLRAHDLGSALQVGFDVGEALAGANARVDLVDMKGHVVNTASFKAESGRNEVSLERPVRGLYVLRAAVGREVAVQKIMVK